MFLFSQKQKNKAIQKSWRRSGSRAVYFTAAKKEKEKRRRKFSRFLFWLLLVCFLGICVYLLLFSPFLDVDNISIEGNREISEAEIVRVVEKSLDGKIFQYLPQRNFFLANRKNISQALQNNFDRLEVISVEKKFPKTILVKVNERKAEIIWCSAGVCYFVDKNGLVYGGTAETEEELRAGNSLVVVDDSAIPVEIGKTRINPEYISYIEAVNSMLWDDLEIGTEQSYHTPGVASQEISVQTKEGWILKISSEYSIEEAKKIIQMLFEKDLNQEARKNLDYLDLRVKGKVYYKTK